MRPTGLTAFAAVEHDEPSGDGGALLVWIVRDGETIAKTVVPLVEDESAGSRRMMLASAALGFSAGDWSSHGSVWASPATPVTGYGCPVWCTSPHVDADGSGDVDGSVVIIHSRPLAVIQPRGRSGETVSVNVMRTDIVHGPMCLQGDPVVSVLTDSGEVDAGQATALVSSLVLGIEHLMNDGQRGDDGDGTEGGGPA